MSHELLGDERRIIESPISEENAHLIADSLTGTESAEIPLEELAENDRAFIGSILQKRMGEWDITKGPNPYAEVVYSMFPPVGGS